MKKPFFIVLIALVLVITGIFCWLEFSLPAIVYVTDYTDKGENQYAVKRLYSSDVDIDAFTAEIEARTSMTEYNDEEYLAAALACGKPEFFPVFYGGIYDNPGGGYRLNGYVQFERTERQTDSRFLMKDFNLEMMTADGLFIEEAVFTPLSAYKNEAIKNVVSEDRQSMIAELDKVNTFDIMLTGTGGRITMRYTYKIVADTIFQSDMLTEQLLLAYITVTPTPDGSFTAEFTVEPYSSLEDE